MRRQLVYRTLVLLAVILSFSAALPLADTAAKPGNGNSENAKACQKGGWATLAPQETPGAAFQNQDECVSYGAQGGVLVPHVVLNPVITVGMSPAEGFCVPNITATGFAPNTAYVFIGYINNGGESVAHRGELTTDSAGALSFGGPSFIRVSVVSYRVVIGGFSSEATPYLC